MVSLLPFLISSLHHCNTTVYFLFFPLSLTSMITFILVASPHYLGLLKNVVILYYIFMFGGVLYTQ